MVDYIADELSSGKDDYLQKVLSYFEEKSQAYYRKLSAVFGEECYFKEFRDCYNKSEIFHVIPQDNDLVRDQLCAILEWRSVLATEVEALQEIRREVEDYPRDFEIQSRLSESLHEINRLQKELDTLREKNERLQIENNAFNSVLEEVKRGLNAKVAEANERAKKAEKAFVDLTRRRYVQPPSDPNKTPKPSSDTAAPVEPKAASGNFLNTISSTAVPYKSSLDKVRNSSMHFMEYSTLTAWEGFDSLDEDSSDEEEKGKKTETAEVDPASPPLAKSAKLESLPSSSASQAKGPSTPDQPSGPISLPSFDASPIRPSKSPVDPSMDADESGGVETMAISLSSTPKKSPAHVIEVVAPLLNQVESVATTTTTTTTATAKEIVVPSSDVVDKAAYLQLYDEVMELRSELEKVRGQSAATASIVGHQTSPLSANDLGLTNQLNELRDQVNDTSVKDLSFASPASMPGVPPIKIPLMENKHITDWSVCLDQTNTSCAADDQPQPAQENQHHPQVAEGGEIESYRTPRGSMSIGQQTDLVLPDFNGSLASTHSLTGCVFANPEAVVATGAALSPASTLQDVNVDFSEATTKQGQPTEFTESACSPMQTLVKATTDAASECNLLSTEALEEQNRQLTDSLIDAACVCVGLQSRLSGVQNGIPSRATFDVNSFTEENCADLTSILRKLSAEVESIAKAFVELKEKQASQPSYEEEIVKLREKLEEAERQLEERLSTDSKLAALRMSQALEAEREQLQRELDQRLADYGSTHATSVAELEQAQADLSARLVASQRLTLQLEGERDSVKQRLHATERFLNEQLQERDQEREEFQLEVSGLKKEISTLRNRLATLERQQCSMESSSSSSIAATPVTSPRRSRTTGCEKRSLVTSTPIAAVPQPPVDAPKARAPLSRGRSRTVTPPSSLVTAGTSDHSDIDDCQPFELVPTPTFAGHVQAFNPPDWTRPMSAGDASVRQQVKAPAPMISTCVGGSPVELIDASVSAQSSLRCSSSSTSTEVDYMISCSEDEEIDNIETVTTTAAALGVVTTTVTKKRSKRKSSSATAAASKHSARLSAIKSPVPPNSIGLDVEMRHVEEMENMRRALDLVQSTMEEKEAELEVLRKQVSSTAPEAPKHFGSVSVQVQTSVDSPEDAGVCWSCLGRPNSAPIRVVAASVPSMAGARGSRDSTLSPPPLADRSGSESHSSHAEASVSSAEEVQIAEEEEHEENEEEEEEEEEVEDEVYRGMGRAISSSESDHLAAQLEEALAEITRLKEEINGLMNYQDDLHRDFEVVQSMLEERQSEVERLQKDLLELPVRMQADFDASVRKLQKRLTAAERCEVVEERDEDLYVLNEEKEALAKRVEELEKELNILRQDSSPNTVNHEDTASQTDPPYCTMDSGIQVDLSAASPHPSDRSKEARASCADTDCASEEDLPFDGDYVQVVHQAPVTATSVEGALAAVDTLERESCRLLGLSLAGAGTSNSQDGDSQPPVDHKSQLISRLIEANRMLKAVVEKMRNEDVPLADTHLENEEVTRSSLSHPLYSTLLTALLADRKADLSFVTSGTIDRTSAALLDGRLLVRPKSGNSAGRVTSVSDVMRALDGYSSAEEERWKTLSSALESDREDLLKQLDQLRRREESLQSEVARLTNQIEARDSSLALKSASINELTAQANKLEATITSLQQQLADKENQVALSRCQVDEERARTVEMESAIKVSQAALKQSREKISSLEAELKQAFESAKLAQSRSHLSELRVSQLEQEIKTLKSSYVRAGPKAFVNGGLASSASSNGSLRRQDPSAIAKISNQLASARQQALQAEKMSNELHNTTRDLRVCLAEAELALLPVSLGKENGLSSGSTSGDDDNNNTNPATITAGVLNRALPKQLTDSGFADTPAGLRCLQLACLRLLHLVTMVTDEDGHSSPSPTSSSSSSSSDSLNNPAELLRHAVLGGKRGEFVEHASVPQVYACLAEIEAHVRALVGANAGGTHDKTLTGEATMTTTTTVANAAAMEELLAKARHLIMSGVACLDSGLGTIATAGKVALTNGSVARVPTESKSIQCSLMVNSHSSGDSRVVSLEKFRHMSARYLRMESYRRALVYQKQYLLLLLGDFHYTVQRVTGSLGQGLLMGTSSRQDLDGEPLPQQQQWPLATSPALVRFRAAARCIMVIHRVKQLRLRWQRTGIRNHAPLFSHTTDSRSPNTPTVATAAAGATGSSPTLVAGTSRSSSSQGSRSTPSRTPNSPRQSGLLEDCGRSQPSQSTAVSHPHQLSTRISPQKSQQSPSKNHHQPQQQEASTSFLQERLQPRASGVQHYQVPTSTPATALSNNSSLARFQWGSPLSRS